MKTFPASKPVRAVLFDIDNTLYRHKRYVFSQVDLLIHRLAEHRGEKPERTRALVTRTREQIIARTGRKPSLGNTFVALGVPITTSVAWRKELIHPEAFLHPDPALQELLCKLAGDYRLGAITNNPEEVGMKTLDVLGVSQYFETLVGLDTTMHSKPAWEPFAFALARLGVAPHETVVVGDRYDVDLEPVICRGGGGVLIEEDADLPRILDLLPEMV
ncbi:MAG: HAD family hydrolase [Spirochaetaceae bacterium]|nr:MAG: HAD family hydrolase [Spirochaetaceae bacterium]